MRKIAKKHLSLLLTLAMMLSLCVSASAATTITLEVGDDQPVSPSYQGEHIWTSEDTSIAEVVEIGDASRASIVGISAGGTVVNCTTIDEDTGDYHLDTWNVRVTAAEPEPEPEPDPEIELQQNRLDMDEGDETRLLYEVTGITGYTVNWTSSNSSVVSVDSSGNISARRAGSATITATIRGTNASDSCDITVSAVAEPEIELERGSVDLGVGSTATLRSSVTGIVGYTVDWSSSNPAVVSVDGSGNIRGLRAGSATITARIRGTSAYDTCEVIVEDTSEPLLVSMTSQTSMLEGNTETLTANASGGSGSGYRYSWGSSNANVVSVSGGNNKSVTITGVGSGNATIYVDVVDSAGNGDRATCAVRVDAKSQPTSTTYNPTGSTTAGSNLNLNNICTAIANQFRRDLGSELSLDASVRFATAYNDIGAIQFGNTGNNIASNYSYSYAVMQDMYFHAFRAGTFNSYYSIQDGGKTISGTISISVSGGQAITNVTMSPTSLNMAPYSTRSVSLSLTPSSASYQNISWSSSNTNIASISGSGLSVYVNSQGRAGNATITATVRDAYGSTISRSCNVYVASSASYSPSVTVTVGSDYYGTSTSDSMRRQFRDIYGVTLPNNATIVFSGTGNNRLATMRLANGSAIQANRAYTFQEYIDMYTETYSSGTFSVPYELSYNGNTLSGDIEVYIRSSNLTVTMKPTSLNLDTYSNDYLDLTVSPRNAYHSVSWSTSNSNIATVSGSGDSVKVNTHGRTGTATITATVRDNAGISVVKRCTVTVASGSSYNPSVATTLGVNYVGTGTSDAMISQFRNVYGVTINNDNATIRFSNTGNNDIAVMRLANGTAIRANTDYTMSQYIAMYTEPLAAGSFVVPYTLTYRGNTLSGNVTVNITAGSMTTALEIAANNPYLFSTAASNGSVGSTMLNNTINNAIGSNWSYIRFGSSSSNVGRLYLNSQMSNLGNSNIYPNSFSNLYFVPSQNGLFSIPYTVYNSRGGTMGNGTLFITVGSTAAVNFSDVPANAYYAPAVQWAVQKGVTNGTSPTTFEPEATCTRGQVATFLWRANGSPEPKTTRNPFSDVLTTSNFYKAILWANENGIALGYDDGTFRPSGQCTRGHVITFLHRAKGQPAASGYSSMTTAYPGRFFTTAAAWADTAGVLSGTSRAFTPDEPCPRSDIVTYLYRAYQ